MADTPSLLHVENVDLEIDGRDILKGINISSNAARVAVLGRNGSGKSTLARLIAGLQLPDRGRVHVAGVDVAGDRRGALGAVGILFQNPDHQIIFPTVHEELGFGLGQMGLGKAETARRVQEILARFGKEGWHDAAVHRLSQGQRQLVCLMSILVMRPEVIILDEPFSGLDIPTMLHLTRVLATVDAALIHITHDPRMIASYDHALWIEQGSIAQQGAADVVAEAYLCAMHELGARDDLTDIAS
ncbi:MAG: ABC transporter ATP-binding protein [Sulfitobacter sp.]